MYHYLTTMDDELSEAGQLEAVKRDDANLDCLYFQGAGWPDNKVDGPAFAKAMKTNTHVESFEMTDCSQGDDTAVACANMLKSNNTLQMLGLALNNITDVGALALADALKTNTGLEELYVHGNELTNLGAVALLDALDLNSNITTLNVKSEVLACGHVSTDRIISDWIIDGIKRACKGNEDKIRTLTCGRKQEKQAKNGSLLS